MISDVEFFLTMHVIELFFQIFYLITFFVLLKISKQNAKRFFICFAILCLSIIKLVKTTLIIPYLLI